MIPKVQNGEVGFSIERKQSREQNNVKFARQKNAKTEVKIEISAFIEIASFTKKF